MTDHAEAAPPARPAPAPLPRQRLAGLTGRQVLDKMLAGDLPLPPFGTAMDIQPLEVAEGRVVFVGRPSTAFSNPMGTVHGGWIATIIDSAMGCAVHSTLRPGQSYATTSLTVNYVRPLFADVGEVRCEAVALHAGGRLATAEGRLLDGAGRLIAHASETCMILGSAADGAARTPSLVADLALARS